MSPIVSELSDRAAASPSRLLLPISFTALMDGVSDADLHLGRLLASDRDPAWRGGRRQIVGEVPTELDGDGVQPIRGWRPAAVAVDCRHRPHDRSNLGNQGERTL